MSCDCRKELKVDIKYFDNTLQKLQKIDVGDWVDLRVRNIQLSLNSKESIEQGLKYSVLPGSDKLCYSKGDIVIVKLGVAIKLPKGYESLIVPRSGLFKNHGLLLVNSVGVIDNAYQGDNDEWSGIFLATRDDKLEKGERILQFKVVQNMPEIEFNEVKKLEGKDRNGFGSTGIN